MMLLLSVVLWLVDSWKFWQKGHMLHPPGVKWWWRSAWGLLEPWYSAKLCAILHAHQSCRGDTLSCSESEESEQGYTKYQRMLYGRVACFLPAYLTRARCCSTPAAWCGMGEGTTCLQEEDGPSHRFILPVFSAVTCALQSTCTSQHRELSGPVMIPRDPFCPDHCSATAASRDSLGGSVRYLFHVFNKRKEPRGAEKNP